MPVQPNPNPATIIQIGEATVAFGPVPGPGETLESPAFIAGLTDFRCQVTSAAISSTSNTNTTTVDATFCAPASERSVPVSSSFQLDLEFFQDWTNAGGLSAWLFKNDATEQAFALYLDDQNNPVATGIIIAQAGGFGGKPGEALKATSSLSIQGYPAISDPTGQPLRPITTVPDPLNVTTTYIGPAATADAFTTLANLQGDGTHGTTGTGLPYNGGTGTKATMTTGQYALINNGATKVNWTGTAWVAGAA